MPLKHKLAVRPQCKMAKKFDLYQAPSRLRSLVLAGAVILAGCATPTGAPCSNWSVRCGCYCGASGAWSGIEPEPPGEAPKWTTPFTPRPDHALNAQDKKAIRTVYIDHNVALPQTPRVWTRSDSLAEGYGGLVAIKKSTDRSKEQATVEYLDANKIRIDAMLVDAFTIELESRNQFSVIKSPIDADATIRFVVLMYGVEHTFNPFSRNYRTLLNARATMAGPGDKMVWIKEISTESDDQSLATLKELYGDPEIMRKHMSIVARIWAKRMVDHLLGAQ